MLYGAAKNNSLQCTGLNNLVLYKVTVVEACSTPHRSQKKMDFRRAAVLSGSRFSILSGQLAKLERSLATFMLEMHTQEFGYTEIFHPSLVNDNAMYNVGQLPKFSHDSFKTTNDLRLAPTSEVVLTNLVAGTSVACSSLPMRFTAYSQCFRAEAGSAGLDTKGMIRQHQFSKGRARKHYRATQV